MGNGPAAGPALRVGVVGCGRAATLHVARLCRIEGVEVVACADTDRAAAEALAGRVAAGGAAAPAVYEDHQALLAEQAPAVLAIFTPHRIHYRPALDALQAGCHIFVEKPLTTRPQEAAELARLAAARGLTAAVGHQYRLGPALREARRLLAEGAIGRLRLVTGTLAAPWLDERAGPEDAWRRDPRVAGGGIIADAGDHLLDALIWTTGQGASEVAAFQVRIAPGLDVVTAAALRLADGTPATLGVTGVCAAASFELTYHGEGGRLRATATELVLEGAGPGGASVVAGGPPDTSIDEDFVAALRSGRPPCCTAAEALETVRMLEAIGRSAASGQVERIA